MDSLTLERTGPYIRQLLQASGHQGQTVNPGHTQTDDTQIDAERQPLEFALIACDILLAQGLAVDEAAEFAPVAAEGGFLIDLQFEHPLSLRLAYDEPEAQFMASARLDGDGLGEAQLRRALVLNAVMPLGRRFEMDPTTGALALTERWAAQGLQMEDLLEGMDLIVQAVQSLLLDQPSEPPASPMQATDALRG